MYYDDIVDEIKARLDIVDIVSETVRLTRKGSRYWGLCPFHQEKTPSFCVTPEKGMFYCFGCHAGGDIFSFVMKRDGISFKEALELLASKAGVSPSLERFNTKQKDLKRFILQVNKKAAEFYHNNLKSPKGFLAREYLRKRGISDKTIDLFKLGYAPDEWEGLKNFLLAENIPFDYLQKSGLLRKSDKTGNYYDLFRNRIIFPVFQYNGDIIAFGARVLDDSMPKYINSPETEVFSKGRNLYGIFQAREAIRSANEAILVEGYTDCIKLHQSGVQNVVASLGTAFTQEQARLLCRYAEKVVVLYDGDEAGQRSTLKAIDVLTREKLQVYVASIPGRRDPDEYLDLVGKEDFLTFIKNNKISHIEFKINYYLKNKKSLDLEDKIKIINMLKSDISELESELLRDYYIKILAQKLVLEENIVFREIKRENTKKLVFNGNKKQIKRDNIRYDNSSLEDRLIASMLKNGYIFNRIKTELGFGIFKNQTYREICILYDGLEGGTEEKIKKLEQQLIEKGLMAEYARLMMQDIVLIDESGIEKIIKEVLSRKREAALQKLLQKLNSLKDKGDFNAVLRFLVYLDLFLNNRKEGGIK
ncbi:DNA primase [Thermosyntropha sp.]|uniref:DNA primase n=1 Tax=Thermosyntropha sp. TaxID=2740820 RepID=UPI0025D54778|nr:DNA primase [Thermosyntropha sp.]MBO8158659.1 DNA primase [Thermosyntropha sp.]